jgi:hypothetical protein
MDNRYSIENLKRSIVNPRLIISDLHRIFQNELFNLTHTVRSPVINYDWDNLIILDACRYDYFREESEITGELNPTVTRGGGTVSFLRKNFYEKQLHNTIYISANPQTEKLPSNTFFLLSKLYYDEWNHELETVLPDRVTQITKSIEEDYPNKRYIIHFMQPHEPFLGKVADRWRKKYDLRGITSNHTPTERRTEGTKAANLAHQNKISIREFRQGYRETLQKTLNHVSNLVSSLTGKTVITSDHGEMLGEKLFPFSTRKWGHSSYLNCRYNRVVPWLVIDSEQRRDISHDAPIEAKNVDGKRKIINDRLESLGYAEN